MAVTGWREMKTVARKIEWISWVVVVLALLKILPVTALVFWPQKAVIEGGTVTMYRTFPLDTLGLSPETSRPFLSYVEIVKPLTRGHNGGQNCQSNGGPFQYIRADDTGFWDITEWAAGCLDDPHGFIWSARWTWHLFGFTFGSVSHSETVIRSQYP